LCLTVLSTLVFWPGALADSTALMAGIPDPVEVETLALSDYLDLLARRGVDVNNQGIRIESLDGSLIFASHQSEETFNPASVIKVATTLAALERFGASHRFTTAFHIDGTVEEGTLTGDLILSSDGDPVLGTAELNELAREVIRTGVRRVDGDLVISGPFTVGNLHRSEQVARYLVQQLRRLGIRTPDAVVYGKTRGILVSEHVSDPLIEIVHEQNAVSDNPTADRLGEAIGGPEALEGYLIREIGIPPEHIRVSTTSGLRINRISARGTVRVLRQLARWLDDQGLYPEDVLPVAGIDRGTTRTRFTRRDYRGAVVAKTGTLTRTDGGVSALAGVLYTNDYGPLLFAILNSSGPVIQYREFQDDFIEDVIDEFGGRPLSNDENHRSAS
jgi:D-alanyl-D-alanine carboxypeptidase/D-alanyl-D-alanine-endopeptidase (penicillin-binding protein 4)